MPFQIVRLKIFGSCGLFTSFLQDEPCPSKIILQDSFFGLEQREMQKTAQRIVDEVKLEQKPKSFERNQLCSGHQPICHPMGGGGDVPSSKGELLIKHGHKIQKLSRCSKSLGMLVCWVLTSPWSTGAWDWTSSKWSTPWMKVENVDI